MALKDIINTINKEAEKEIKDIERKTQEEVTKIKKEYKEKIDQEKKRILEEVKNQAERDKEQARIKLEAETKKLILEKKQKILSEVYQKALEKLAKLSNGEYIALVTKLLKKCPLIEAQIIPAKGQEKLIFKALEKFSEPYTLSSTLIEAKGGFIFSSPNLEIDNTFETLIKEIRDETEIEVGRILFG